MSSFSPCLVYEQNVSGKNSWNPNLTVGSLSQLFLPFAPRFSLYDCALIVYGKAIERFIHENVSIDIFILTCYGYLKRLQWSELCEFCLKLWLRVRFRFKCTRYEVMYVLYATEDKYFIEKRRNYFTKLLGSRRFHC